MKKIISILLSFSILYTQAAPVAAQAARQSWLTTSPEVPNTVAPRDATATPALDETLRIAAQDADRKAQVAKNKLAVNELMDQIEKAQQDNNFKSFYEKVNQLNAGLIALLSSSLTETRLLGALTLSENLRLHLITPQDAEKAYNAFESILRRASSCTELQCDFYSASARGLAHSRRFHELKQAFLDAGIKEVSVSDQEVKRQGRLNLVKKAAVHHYGSDASNARVMSGMLPAVAALGGVKDVDEVVQSVVNPDLNWYQAGKNRNSYQPANAKTQIAVMDTLLDMGPHAQPVLKKYAFNQSSFVSYVHANINLAYTPLNKADDARNKNNLQTLYCHREFGLDSQADMDLKQKLAYAYGRGAAQSYVTAAGSTACLVVVPTAPDPRKVAKEWTNFVMGEVTFQMAFLGMGFVFSGVKNGVRVLTHFKAIQRVAQTRNMSVGKFFLKGGLNELPIFGTTQAARRAAKGAKAVGALTAGAREVDAAGRGAKAAEGARTASKAEASGARGAKQAEEAIAQSAASARQTTARLQDIPKGPVKTPVFIKGKTSEFVYINPNYKPRMPVLNSIPKPNPVTKRFPSGMWDEEGIVARWLEQYKNGYFHPRNQIEAITGMSAQKANNVTEYLYYLSLDDARETILKPLISRGRLPDFIYDSRLIEGTARLPSGYYKNKFNQNVEKLLAMANQQGSLYTNHFELSDIIVAMRDYSFKQGFAISNDAALTAGLRKHWLAIVEEVEQRGIRGNASKLDGLWKAKVETGIMENKFQLIDGKYISVQAPKEVSLLDYFSQTRSTAFFKEGKRPDFYLNSEKWLSWENERRNLAAKGYISRRTQEGLTDRIQNFFVLGNRKKYLAVDEFSDVMTNHYLNNAAFKQGRSLSQEMAQSAAALPDAPPTSLKIRINNYEVTGGACQMAITDGGACYKPRAGYDGTSMIDRFAAVVDQNVKAVVFDFEKLTPRIVTLKTVPHVKDLKPVDLDLVRAGTMVGDRLDASSDLITVQQAEAALRHIPNLRATIHPHSRLLPGEIPEGLNGGGIGAYLTLFTPDFYPLKTVYRLRFKGFVPQLTPQYYVRKEVASLAGPIHQDRLTFFEQVADRIVK